MTIEIDQHRRARALEPPTTTGQANSGPGRLVIGIGLFGAATGLAGLILVGYDLVTPHGLRFAVYAAACLVLTGLAGGLICFRAMLASCQEFYRRGQLDGWMKGWRGQEPEIDDPLLR